MASSYYILDRTDIEDKLSGKDEHRNSYCLYLESTLPVKSISMSLFLFALALIINPHNTRLQRNLRQTFYI